MKKLGDGWYQVGNEFKINLRWVFEIGCEFFTATAIAIYFFIRIVQVMY